MLEQMTASQFAEWMAYAEVEPFGPQADDIRHGQLMSMTANINRDTKARPAAFTAADFMLAPPPRPEVPEETPQQLATRIKSELFGM